MKKKFLQTGMAVVLLSSLLAGCTNLESSNTASNSAGTEKKDTVESAGADASGDAKDTSGAQGALKVLTFGQANAKEGLDMQTSTSSLAASIADSVTESLLRFDDNNQEEPVLLTDFPELSEDGTVYSFELKPDVYFTNGEQLTSDDVKYTFERMFTPATGAKSYGYFSMIKGAADMLEGKAEELAGFEIQDDRHFTITLDYAYAPFLKNIGTSYADIFPADACKEAGDSWGVGTNLIGTGPYKIASNDDTTEVVLVKNENYHGGDVNLDELRIKFFDDTTTKLLAFENGDIDFCDLPSDLLGQYSGTYADQITVYYPLGTAFMSLNLNAEYIKDVKVRQAMSLAINREELVSTILNGAGIPATSFLNREIPGHDSSLPIYEYNPEKAKQILADAGYGDIKITADVRQESQTIYAAIQGYLSAVGITMELNVVDNATWNDMRTNGKTQLTDMRWNALYPDADFQMYNYFYSEKSNGKGVFYNNKEYDKLLDGGRTETDEAKRAQIYKQADKILSLDDMACIPLYYPQSQFIAKPYVKDMAVGNLIYHMWNVDVDADAKNAN